MKKIPRDLSGSELIKLLKPFGYEVVRQSGSHIRLSTSQNGEHHITIPNHNPLKLGTITAILNEIATHFSISKEQLLEKIL